MDITVKGQKTYKVENKHSHTYIVKTVELNNWKRNTSKMLHVILQN